MSKNQTRQFSRRDFIGTSLIGMAGFTLLPGFKSFGKVFSPNDTINLGFIGMGQQAMYLLNGFLSIEGVQVIAGCDVYGIKRQRFEKRVKAYYEKAKKTVEVKTYEKYQDLLANKDINAVVIAVPDHWHALIAIDACKAGKDVYLEKPLTFTIKEGQTLIKAVRDNNRILGLGSQQRSDSNFQLATRLAREGKLGTLQKINAYVGAPPKPYDLPEQPVPADLNWDLWLGPNPFVHYNEQLNPPISLNPDKNEKFWGGWRWYKETGGGFTTDWGAHMFDIAQWGMGMDLNGPTEIIPAGYQDTKFLTYKYANGVVLTEEPFKQLVKGVKFWGSDGWIEISREIYNASDPSLLPEKKKGTGPYETGIPHLKNFIDSVRTRKDPAVPVEIGHSSCTVCNLGNIAYDLGRPVKWNPENQTFVNDPEAEKHYHRTYREGYSL
ncbi:MAG: Gfo/Idh/MocA family oxidoreductase [Bacteroidales bacterium]